MVFRVNFLTFWIVANTAFAIVIENKAQITDPAKNSGGGPIIVNDGKWGFLEIFAIYLAALVVYKVFFGVFHILKFKFLFNCLPKYKIPKFDMHQEVKKLRETQDWNESINCYDTLILAGCDGDDEELLAASEYKQKSPGPRRRPTNGQTVNKQE
jgi:hypothetical protein